MVRAKISGQVAAVVNKKSSNNKDYQDIQILQKNPKDGKISTLSIRSWNGLKAEVGKSVEVEGVIRAFKFKNGEVGLSVDVY